VTVLACWLWVIANHATVGPVHDETGKLTGWVVSTQRGTWQKGDTLQEAIEACRKAVEGET
jgi:hypothetical protein